MGFSCSWAPSNGDPTKTATVHLRDPNKQEILSNVEYFPEHGYMEYFDGYLTGLKEAVDNSRNKEYVTINGKTYGVMKVTKDYDGRTYKAELKLM